MPWADLNFGKFKFKGISLPQVIFKDADWFFWADAKGAFDNKGALEAQADRVFQRATSIRIPDAYPNHIAQYVIHRPSGLLQELNLIPVSDHRTEHAYYKDVIDLSAPRWFKDYDKSGFKNIIRDLKFYLFGSKSARMSKERCEDFFSDDTNFVLEGQ